MYLTILKPDSPFNVHKKNHAAGNSMVLMIIQKYSLSSNRFIKIGNQGVMITFPQLFVFYDNQFLIGIKNFLSNPLYFHYILRFLKWIIFSVFNYFFSKFFTHMFKLDKFLLARSIYIDFFTFSHQRLTERKQQKTNHNNKRYSFDMFHLFLL